MLQHAFQQPAIVHKCRQLRGSKAASLKLTDRPEAIDFLMNNVRLINHGDKSVKHACFGDTCPAGRGTYGSRSMSDKNEYHCDDLGRPTYRLGMLLLGLLIVLRPTLSAALSVQTFDGIYEPSGVIQFADGSILIAEDEGDEPLHLFSIVSKKSEPSLKAMKLQAKKLKADDFEAAAVVEEDKVFLITSHAATKDGKSKKKREKLIGMRLKDQRVQKTMMADELKPAISDHLKKTLSLGREELEKLDIEGLAYHPSEKTLLIGLRSPKHKEKAIIVRMLNPSEVVEKKTAPVFGKQSQLIDLQGAGVRGFVYDKNRKRYLIAGEAPNKKGKLRPGIWSWSGRDDDKPIRLNLPKLKGVKNIEGLTIATHKGSEYLLFVCDNGNKGKDKGAAYGFIHMGDLTTR